MLHLKFALALNSEKLRGFRLTSIQLYILHYRLRVATSFLSIFSPRNKPQPMNCLVHEP